MADTTGTASREPGRMTIDDLARITHTPRHVGRLPVGAAVCVFDGEKVRPVTSFYTEDDQFVLVVE